MPSASVNAERAEWPAGTPLPERQEGGTLEHTGQTDSTD